MLPKDSFLVNTESELRPRPNPMEVIVLTTLFSVLFAVLFLLLFLRSRQHAESCADQDALLPFKDDPAGAPSRVNDTPSHPQSHATSVIQDEQC
ncbi:MAG: hypothetical protein AAGA96_12475 [Verrucomicrobiota bacterium]